MVGGHCVVHYCLVSRLVRSLLALMPIVMSPSSVAGYPKSGDKVSVHFVAKLQDCLLCFDFDLELLLSHPTMVCGLFGV